MQTWWGECALCGGEGSVIERDAVLLRSIERECTSCHGTGLDKNETRIYAKEQQEEQQRILMEMDRNNATTARGGY